MAAQPFTRLRVRVLAWPIALLAATVIASLPGHAETRSYTVKPGDTLSNIAEQLLGDASRWRHIWSLNPQLTHPESLAVDAVIAIPSAFPSADADALSPQMISVSASTPERSKPTGLGGRTRLSPKIREIPLGKTAAVDIESLNPQVRYSGLMSKDSMTADGRVLAGTQQQVLLGSGSEFFARGIDGPTGSRYRLFRPGLPVTLPGSGETLGEEMIHLGTATVLDAATGSNPISRLVINRAEQEIRSGDHLITDADSNPSFPTPFHPAIAVSSQVIKVTGGINEAGPRDIIVIAGGLDQALKPGHLLDIVTSSDPITDPVDQSQVSLPEQQVGQAVVFRVYPRLSFALVLRSKTAIQTGYRLTTPNQALSTSGS